jgi:RNA polymerase sigma factor (TIGR02999 family)
MMSGDAGADLTELLIAADEGATDALNRLFPLVYDELRALAQRAFQAERPEHTLQTTALVHEAYLRLVQSPSLSWQNRRHFFGIAARAMRQILVEHARGRGAQKRSAGRQVTLDDELLPDADQAPDILELDEALKRLALVTPRAAQIVELRYFAGLGIEETAEVVGVSLATVKRDWLTARAWLKRELE